MKFLWNLLSVVAVANLFALLGFVGWLKYADRLDRDRLHEVRQVFSTTVAQRKADETTAAAKAEEDKKAAAIKAKEGTPPVTASETLDLKLQASQVDQTRLEGLRREVAILQDTLRRERAALDADRAAFDKQREEFQRARDSVAKTEGNAQFKKTLATIEALKPDKAKIALQQLIIAKQSDEAVEYLNAMQDRSRTKIVEEFLKDDPKVATELLERIRTRGIIARGPEGSPG
jgi:hypothetical protein